MAVRRQKRAVVDKWKKKKKFVIMGPKSVGNVEIGETVADKPEMVIGRKVKTNMGLLLNQARKKNIDLTFKINDVQGSNAPTSISGYEVKKSFLRRLFRRRSSKIESIEYLTTKDKKKIKFVSVIVTFRKVEREKQRAIRKLMTDHVKDYVKSNNSEQIMSGILEKNPLEPILDKVKKIARFKKAEVEEIKLL